MLHRIGSNSPKMILESVATKLLVHGGLDVWISRTIRICDMVASELGLLVLV
jgi:hypothetical protein